MNTTVLNLCFAGEARRNVACKFERACLRKLLEPPVKGGVTVGKMIGNQEDVKRARGRRSVLHVIGRRGTHVTHASLLTFV